MLGHFSSLVQRLGWLETLSTHSHCSIHETYNSNMDITLHKQCIYSVAIWNDDQSTVLNTPPSSPPPPSLPSPSEAKFLAGYSITASSHSILFILSISYPLAYTHNQKAQFSLLNRATWLNINRRAFSTSRLFPNLFYSLALSLYTIPFAQSTRNDVPPLPQHPFIFYRSCLYTI